MGGQIIEKGLLERAAVTRSTRLTARGKREQIESTRIGKRTLVLRGKGKGRCRCTVVGGIRRYESRQQSKHKLILCLHLRCTLLPIKLSLPFLCFDLHFLKTFGVCEAFPLHFNLTFLNQAEILGVLSYAFVEH